MGLVDFAKAYPAQLSGGMRQRVCIARTLVMQPRLILLDEPFGALDAQTRLVMGDELLKVWRATGATVLLITHALDEAAMLSDRIGIMSAGPAGSSKNLKPAGRASAICASSATGLRRDYRPAVGAPARRIAQGARSFRPRRAGGRYQLAVVVVVVRFDRLVVIVVAVGALELACRLGLINHNVIIPPSEMASALWTLLASGALNAEIERTLGMIALVIAISIALGFAIGCFIHALPRVREALDPFFATYYAVPVFIFYPVLIAIFGLWIMPIVVIGVATAVVAMIIATLNGLDRVPHVLTKVARVHRLGRIATTLQLQLPAAAPYLFIGVKLSVSYGFIAVIAAEFILSPAGLGRDIAEAYADFDNRRMYALILFLLIVATLVNAVLHGLDIRFAERRSGGRA